MRVLGLDMGERRVGVAVSDPEGRVATPLKVLDAGLVRDPSPLRRLIEDYEAELIVVGLPVSMDGSEGPQASRIRSAANRIARLLGVEVRYHDERLSSVEAERVMREAGLSERDRRGSVDKVAASLILQSFLDSGGLTTFRNERRSDG